MNAIFKNSRLNGRIYAPPSKSMAHRFLICAALSRKKCIVSNIAFSEDITATLNCLESLGVCCERTADKVIVDADALFSKNDVLNCKESGSTLRFLIPLCLLADKEITLVGKERLFSRSLAVYKSLCEEKGFTFKQDCDSVLVKGNLKSGYFSVRGDISSQFISGLLFVLPTLEGDSIIEIEKPIESLPYIDMTVYVQSLFGVIVERNDNIIKIKGNQQYIPTDAVVEGDCSNAAFFEALSVLGHNVEVYGINKDTFQGDFVFYEYFDKLRKGFCELDISNCPDLAPVLSVVAAANYGAKLIGTRRLKIKESDRAKAIFDELNKFSVKVSISENEMVIDSGIKVPILDIESHNDHRIVMAFACLLTLTGGRIVNCEAVNKSFPDFFEKLMILGADITYET